MAALIWLGNLYGKQEKVKAHCFESEWNLDEDSKNTGLLRSFIAKGNILEGIEAKT